MIGNPTEGLKQKMALQIAKTPAGRMIGNPTEGLKQQGESIDPSADLRPNDRQPD